MREEIIKTSFAKFRLVSENDEILKLEFFGGKKNFKSSSLTKFAKKVENQLNEYFAGRRKEFDLNYAIDGTSFQKQVWRTILKIPFGKTKTYQDVAQELGNKNLSRAVGQALKSNKIVIIIPCHRVVAKNGLGGYSGKKHKNLKRELLRIEGVFY